MTTTNPDDSLGSAADPATPQQPVIAPTPEQQQIIDEIIDALPKTTGEFADLLRQAQSN